MNWRLYWKYIQFIDLLIPIYQVSPTTQPSLPNNFFSHIRSVSSRMHKFPSVHTYSSIFCPPTLSEYTVSWSDFSIVSQPRNTRMYSPQFSLSLCAYKKYWLLGECINLPGHRLMKLPTPVAVVIASSACGWRFVVQEMECECRIWFVDWNGVRVRTDQPERI
jgi:hypothetical protein